MNRWLAPLALLCACVDYDPQGPEQQAYPLHDPGPIDDSGAVTDRWSWPEYPVDLLFLVDNSGSMLDDQTRLTSNVPKLVEPLATAACDYHVGLLTTDCLFRECGQLLEWFDPETVPPDEVSGHVQDMIGSLGTGGAGTETGIWSLYEAIRLWQTDNAGFFRLGVPHHVIIVSDEPDQSRELTDTTVTQLYRALDAVHDNGGLHIDSIVHTHGGESSGCTAEYAPQYLALTLSFPGIAQEICDEDWSPAIAQIAASFVPRELVFSLSRIPVLDTIEVHVARAAGDVVLDGSAWTYEPTSNAISVTDEASTELHDVSSAWITYIPAE